MALFYFQLFVSFLLILQVFAEDVKEGDDKELEKDSKRAQKGMDFEN